jgi:hypothetical protein
MIGSWKNYRRTTLVASFILTVVAFSPGQRQAPPDVKQLVRDVITNELQSGKTDQTRWMYRLQRQEADKITVREVVETRDCDVHLLLASDGAALTPAQLQKENKRLETLVHDPQEQRRKRHEQQEDDRKAVEMFKMLPEAFLYQYRGSRGSLEELTFRPNPDFRPPSREAQVFHGMEGSMVVDADKKQLVEIDGHLAQDVEFLGGLFGHLDKGGHFVVKRAEVGPGHWAITELNVEMKGKALIFKSINLRQKDRMSDFRTMPADLSAAQAVDILKAPGFAQVAAHELADSNTSHGVVR